MIEFTVDMLTSMLHLFASSASSSSAKSILENYKAALQEKTSPEAYSIITKAQNIIECHNRKVFLNHTYNLIQQYEALHCFDITPECQTITQTSTIIESFLNTTCTILLETNVNTSLEEGYGMNFADIYDTFGNSTSVLAVEAKMKQAKSDWNTMFIPTCTGVCTVGQSTETQMLQDFNNAWNAYFCDLMKVYLAYYANYASEMQNELCSSTTSKHFSPFETNYCLRNLQNLISEFTSTSQDNCADIEKEVNIQINNDNSVVTNGDGYDITFPSGQIYGNSMGSIIANLTYITFHTLQEYMVNMGIDNDGIIPYIY